MFTSFFVRTNGKLIAFPFDEILYITAKHNYCEVVTTKKKFLLYVSLSRFEEKLPENLFCRVHRSHIIAVQKVSSFDHSLVEIQGQLLPINKSGFEAICKHVLIVYGDLENKLNKEIEGMDVEEYLNKTRRQKKDEQ